MPMRKSEGEGSRPWPWRLTGNPHLGIARRHGRNSSPSRLEIKERAPPAVSDGTPAAEAAGEGARLTAGAGKSTEGNLNQCQPIVVTGDSCINPAMKRRSLLLMAVLIGLSPIAIAEANQQRDLRNDTGAPIVVTGERPTREQARERATTFVRQVGVARGDIAAARWADRICPRVLGIAQAYSAIVEARMRQIAEAAGMRVAPPGCRTNITVSFVGDAAALMRDINERSPTRLNEVPRGERAAMLNGAAPIRWWYLTEIRSRHQMRNAPQSVETRAGESASTSSVTSSTLDVEALSQYSSSLISTQGARAIVDANVVIDLDGAEGQSLQAVAAYAAFVAYSEVHPSSPPPAGSILGMFGPETGLRGLTDWDMAFLRALYQLPLDREARRHRGLLVRDMVNYQMTQGDPGS